MSLKKTSPLEINHKPAGCLTANPRASEQKVHVAMLGARNHYAVPRLLNRAGMLGNFYTDIYASDKAWVVKIFESLPPKLRLQLIERFLGRAEKELPTEKIISFLGFGLWYWWQQRSRRDNQALSDIYAEGAKAFNRLILRQGLTGADILYGYNGAALELFQNAKEQGILCVLEQTLAPMDVVRILLKEELERWPELEPKQCLDGSEDILAQREQVEWQLADLIIGGSSFVINGLTQQQVPETKCHLIPYGVPLELFSSSEHLHSSSSPKLRILFAGLVGLRKGVPYLLEALRVLNSSHIEARFAGPVAVNSAWLRPYQGVATFLGLISRSKMLDLYHWADLFVLPSICEGSALVTYEALACGLPVIATPNTGAWVCDQINGLIVPIRDVEALAIAVDRFARDQEFLRFCRHNVQMSRDRVGLEAYQKRLVRTIRGVIGGPVIDA